MWMESPYDVLGSSCKIQKYPEKTFGITKMKTEQEEFFKKLTHTELLLVNELKKILDGFPSLKVKLSYSVLYYFQKSRVCFIWPASIKSGPKTGVQLGFCNGYLLEDKYKLLEKENRKQVYCLTFHNTSEIKKEIIKYYLSNAIEVDAIRFGKIKKP